MANGILHADKPADRNLKFYQTDYDVSVWDTNTVPMSWQAAGYDKAIYTNITYSWTRACNGGGAKKLEGNIQFFVFFQGVESAFYVWINGHEVGYGEDSYTPAHFNITPYLQDRTNIIAVQVFRCSDGSYVED